MKYLFMMLSLISSSSLAVCFSKIETAKAEFDASEAVLIVKAINIENEYDPDDNNSISGRFFTLEVIDVFKGI